jgi:hypothetical protein
LPLAALASQAQRKYLKRMTNKLLLFALILLSCNPVKQVLNNKQKLDEVAKEVIKMGYCANDTTIVVKSDTLIEMDTFTIIAEKPFIEIINDTVYVTKWKTNNITKSVTIHDTIKAVVVDNSRVKLFQEESEEWQKRFIEQKQKASNLLFLLIFILSLIALSALAKLKRLI